MIWKPHVTVAAVVERDGKYLLVEEQTDEGIRYNQPAGHLECDEALIDAVVREALEETGYHFVPTALIGVYHWRNERSDITYLRFAFAGEVSAHDASRNLDSGIIAAHWLDFDAVRRLEPVHRSPLILRCIEDLRAGKRFPLELFNALRMKRWLVLALFFALPAAAEERVAVCYNYGCNAQAEIVYSEAQLAEIATLLKAARDAGEERAALGLAVGQLLGWAGAQSPIEADRGGNLADAGVSGMMDCIDHSTSTTRLLQMLERRGSLRHHRVVDPALRSTLFVFLHYSAQIEEVTRAATQPPARFVVDSWFFDNGEPAAVMPLAHWMAGGSPDAK